MVKKLKIHWIFWNILVCIVTIGALLDHTVRPIVIPIKLTENAPTNVSIFRPFPDSLRISLKFDNIKSEERPIVGSWRTEKGDWHKTGFINFIEPGEPILLQVSDNVNTTIYEAEPAGGVESSKTVWRYFVPYINDGKPNIFVWPPRNELRYQLDPGKTNLNICVLQVGSNIRGNIASLCIESPVSFKATHPNYKFVWWFMFWPIYAIVLLFYGVLLVRAKKKKIKLEIL